MNVAYNEISCADAAKMLGIDYSTVAKWCKAGRINCFNVSGGTSKGRYVIKEDEIEYIKHLKQKFGKDYLQKYRKDWKKGTEPVKDIVYVEPTMPVPTIKSVVTDVVPAKKRADIDELAIKIGYIQDIKDKLEELEIQKNQLTAELESLRKEVMEYL